MAERIHQNQSPYIPGSDNQGVAEAQEDLQPTPAAAPESATQTAPPPDADKWEETGPSFQDFLNPPSPHEPKGADGFLGHFPALEPARAVWEMISADSTPIDAPSSSPSAETTAASSAPPAQQAPLQDNLVVSHLGRAFESLSDGAHSDRAIRRELRIQVFNKIGPAQREALLEAAGSGEDLRTRLLEIHNDPRLADQFVAEVQATVVAMAGEEISRLARPHFQAGMEQIEQINNSSDSRRAFLATIALQAESQAEISTALRSYGFTSRSAENIAETLETLRTDPHRMQAFLHGDAGARSLGALRGEFNAIERRLESELSSIHSGLESLERSLLNNELRHDRFLTDPTIAPFREQAFANLGARTGPPGQENGLGALFNHAAEESGKAQRNERIMIGVINVAGGLALGLATGGTGLAAILAAGGANAAGSLPDNFIAHQDVHRAQGAALSGLGSPDLVDKARSDRNVGIAMSAANALIGMVPSDVIIKNDELQAFGLDVAREVFAEAHTLAADIDPIFSR